MTETEYSSPSSHNGFVGLTLVCLSVITVLGWDLIVARQLHSNGTQLREQQTKMVEQSRVAQTGLEKLARDLIDVSHTDDDAKAIVTKYNIAVANPAPGASPAASPNSSPK
jgi:hypothetical protein